MTDEEERAEFRKMMCQMRDDLKTVKEIVIAWNNIKGFVQIVKTINSVLWVTFKICAVIAAILTAIYLYGKTGHWTWPTNHGGGS